ncbi:MAG TPA: hypothetical protein VEZ48_03360 [Sphingomonadaceae bacterium]|nr:hypothetical protein [Sphingomonadaceae bacterium]
MADDQYGGNRHTGSTLDSFLEAEGVLPQFQAVAIKEVVAQQRYEGDVPIKPVDI